MGWNHRVAKIVIKIRQCIPEYFRIETFEFRKVETFPWIHGEFLNDLLRLPNEGKHHDWWWSCFVFKFNNGTWWKQNSVSSSFWWIPDTDHAKKNGTKYQFLSRLCIWKHGCFTNHIREVYIRCGWEVSTSAMSKLKHEQQQGPRTVQVKGKCFTWLNNCCRCCRAVRDLHHRCRWNFQRLVLWLFATFGGMSCWKSRMNGEDTAPEKRAIWATKKTLPCLPCH